MAGPWGLQDTVVVLDEESIAANTPQTASLVGVRGAAVFVRLDNDEGNANPDVTISVIHETGTEYSIHQAAVAEGETLVAEIPACQTISFESDAVGTWTVEVATNPGGNIEIVEP